MAEIVVLTPEQLAERERKPKGEKRSGRRRSPDRTRIIEEYKAALQVAEPGYGGEVHLSEGEDKRVVRLNLNVAAEELGKALMFRPIKDPSRIQFRVVTPEEKAAKPKRGGRPRKGAQQVELGASNRQAQAIEGHSAATQAMPQATLPASQKPRTRRATTKR